MKRILYVLAALTLVSFAVSCRRNGEKHGPTRVNAQDFSIVQKNDFTGLRPDGMHGGMGGMMGGPGG
ncbi:MAG: hypothetical protein EXR98_22505, partial [Gemmataceae bacterium]|nr:hypothetical protein [Gemmataceae bacterium]